MWNKLKSLFVRNAAPTPEEEWAFLGAMHYACTNPRMDSTKRALWSSVIEVKASEK